MDSKYFWIIEALIGVAILMAIQYGVRVALSRIERQSRKGWRLHVGKIFRPPLTTLLWVLGALYLIDVVGEHIGFSIAVKYLDAFRKTAIVGCSAWMLYRWKDVIEQIFLAHPFKKVDVTTVQMIGRLATLAVGILTALIILQIFGVNIGPLVAFGSIGAASLGFAGKDVMANFCSGIMLQVTRPFVIGDFICLPEKNLEGHVEEIGWFRISLRDKQKRAVYLPNNFLAIMLVVNASRMTHRQIKQSLKIGFKDLSKVSEIVNQMRKHLEKCPQIDTHCPLHVFLKSFGDYACEIEVEAYSTVIDQDAFNHLQHTLLLEFQGIFQEKGVQLPLPIMCWTEAT